LAIGPPPPLCKTPIIGDPAEIKNKVRIFGKQDDRITALIIRKNFFPVLRVDLIVRLNCNIKKYRRISQKDYLKFCDFNKIKKYLNVLFSSFKKKKILM